MESRIEHDSMGEVSIPEGALYGPQTQRAVENFPVSGLTLPVIFIRSLAMIKKHAASVNRELKLIPSEISDATIQACEEVMEGKFENNFPQIACTW